MPTFKIGGVDAITQSNDDIPVIPNTVLNNSLTRTVLNNSLTALDTSASRGATLNADNTALPLFGCRAFVNFNGTSFTDVGGVNHCTIRASGNVSKVVRTGQGTYTITFTIAMPDANYAITQIYKPDNTASGANARMLFLDSQIAASFNVITVAMGGSATDYPIICMSIFR